MPNDVNELTKTELCTLVQSYMKRFDDELDQISIVHGFKHRKAPQHSARHTVLTHQIEKERRDFQTCGIELPDLLNKTNLQYLKEWKGEVNLLPNIKLKKYTENDLKEQ